MTADDACAVPARIGSLPEVMDFVEAFCRKCGATRDDGLRLSLVVEELFTNTVMHGYGGDSEAVVRIHLLADVSHLHLGYEDAAPAFDPLDPVARPAIDPEADVFGRPIGRLGIALVLSLAEHVSYAREHGLNRLQLALRRRG